jgi:hypothetical protein
VTRVHPVLRKNQNFKSNCHTHVDGAGTSFICEVEHCHAVCENLSHFSTHLKVHVKAKTAVRCPFRGCSYCFDGVSESTFKSHFSRCKAKCGGCLDARFSNNTGALYQSVTSGDGTSNNGTVASVEVCDDNNDVGNVYTSVDDDGEPSCSADERSLLLKQLALFTMDLRARHHVSESAIQAIVTNFSQLNSDNMQNVEQKIKKNCSRKAVSSCS